MERAVCSLTRINTACFTAQSHRIYIHRATSSDSTLHISESSLNTATPLRSFCIDGDDAVAHTHRIKIMTRRAFSLDGASTSPFSASFYPWTQCMSSTRRQTQFTQFGKESPGRPVGCGSTGEAGTVTACQVRPQMQPLKRLQMPMLQLACVVTVTQS